MDCLCRYGLTASMPSVRKCPVTKEQLKALVDPIMAVRSTPEHDSNGTLPVGDVYCCIDAGRNRRNMFQGLLRGRNRHHPTKAHEGKTLFKDVIIAKSAESLLARTKRPRGHAQLKLTENMLLCFNGGSTIEYRDLKSYKGGNKANMVGKVAMPQWKELIHEATAFSLLFWGQRLRKVGGPGKPDEDEDDEDDDDVDVGCA